MLDTVISSELTLPVFLLCTAVSLLLGLSAGAISLYKSKCSQSFAVTLVILPAVVQVIIMLVNGNLGAGVAVAGAFSLVRFRSAPGSAKEICLLFLTMAVGLATGMGYLWVAILFFIIAAGVLLLLSYAKFGMGKETERELKITLPESADYEGLFDDLFSEYTDEHTLERVKTVSMGTLFELTYRIVLKKPGVPKEFIDGIRCRNGNLNISCSRPADRESL